MAKAFSFKESMNMTSAVCGSYVSRKEVIEYFHNNYDENKMFEQEELKQIVKELTTGKTRITQTIDKNNVWNYKRNSGREER